MNSKTRAFISAARLRTLPLSVAGIIVGTSMAAAEGAFNWNIFVFAILTTIGFQVLSNFANDYGDGVKGTDNEDRIGPQRALQSGMISPSEMKKAMIITTILTLFTAVMTIYFSFGKENIIYSLTFFILGVAAIVAAIKYTVGNSAYGYHGLGDVFVFIFFGLVSVVGTYFLYTSNINAAVFLPAVTVGLLSTAVLNLNNMRDKDSDAKAGKNTLVVKIGISAARQYHYLIVMLSMVCAAYYGVLKMHNPLNLLYMLSFIPLLIHLQKLRKTQDVRDLDPELKKVALTTFFFAILFLFSFNIFL